MNNHQFDKLLLEISKDEERLRQAEIRMRAVSGLVADNLRSLEDRLFVAPPSGEEGSWQPGPLVEARLCCQEAEKEIRKRSLEMMERIDAARPSLSDTQLFTVGMRAQVLLKDVAENMPASSAERLLVLADAYHAGRMLAVKRRSNRRGLAGLLQAQD